MGENRFQKIDPSLTEEALLKEEQEIFAQNNPEDSAAQLFRLYSPQYRNLVKNMPRKALERLSIALVEGILAETPYNPTTAQEGTAYVLGDKLMQARWVMQLYTLSQTAQEVEAAKQTAPEGSIPLSEVLQSSTESVTIESNELNEGDKNNG